ncbi:MAG: hypothetical protein HXY44_14460 [Syntrophaceae bacterium]|nr:hypothetical protein [Syntrophaceae bacterium]
MKDDNDIERHIERQKKKQSIEGVENRMLRISKKWVTAKLVWIPEREIALLDAFNPEESWWNKIRT